MSCLSSNVWLPYLYLIEHKPTGYKYIGCQYAKGCHPNDLLDSYYTSSRDVQYIIKRDGIEAFDKKIIKTFDVQQIISKHMLLEAEINVIIRPYSKECFNAVKAYVLSQESKILRRLKVKHRFNFFNKTDGTEGQAFYSAMRRIRNAKKV